MARPELELAATARRRIALVRKREELLRKIRHKKSLLSKLELERERAEAWLLEHVAPVWEDCARVNDEVLDVLQQLLTGAATKRARRSVRDVYRALLRRGILSPREESASFDEPDARDEPVPAASAGGAQGEAELRARFRRVALALHPDRVQDESEKARLTEVMKDVTRAFEAGDLAGLLNIEQNWTAGGDAATRESEADLEQLRRVVAELKVQLVAVRARCREVQDNTALALFLEAAGERPRAGRSGLQRLVDAAEEQLEELTRIRDVVVAYQNKEISLQQFLAGPAFHFGGAEYDLEDLVQSFLEEFAEKPSRRRSRNRRGG